jgi:hypothetical protein
MIPFTPDLKAAGIRQCHIDTRAEITFSVPFVPFRG